MLELAPKEASPASAQNFWGAWKWVLTWGPYGLEGLTFRYLIISKFMRYNEACSNEVATAAEKNRRGIWLPTDNLDSSSEICAWVACGRWRDKNQAPCCIFLEKLHLGTSEQMNNRVVSVFMKAFNDLWWFMVLNEIILKVTFPGLGT